MATFNVQTNRLSRKDCIWLETSVTSDTGEKFVLMIGKEGPNVQYVRSSDLDDPIDQNPNAWLDFGNDSEEALASAKKESGL